MQPVLGRIQQASLENALMGAQSISVQIGNDSLDGMETTGCALACNTIVTLLLLKAVGLVASLNL